MRQRSDAIGLVVIDEEDNPTLLLRSDAIGLVVIDEEDNATLLVHRISADDIYQRQEDTIISWTDPEVATDLALSFQESMGCSYICLLCSIVPDPFISRSLLSRSSPAGSKYATCSAKCRCLQALREEGLEHVTRLQFMRHPPKMVGYLNGGLLNALEAATDMSELPAVELRNLPVIAKMLTDVPLFHKDRIASLVLREGYVPKLLDLFRQCEDLENLDGLHHLYRIAKGLVLLNDTNLFDLLFADNAILDLVGALEYGPDLPSRQQHCKFLLEQVEFREALTLTSFPFQTLASYAPSLMPIPTCRRARCSLCPTPRRPRPALAAAAPQVPAGADDPDLPSRQQHRKFLLEQVEYREAVPIQDPSLRSKIHQTYRLGYIKDVILPRVLDDQTYGTFNSLILFNNVEGDKPFLSDLFSQLRSKEVPSHRSSLPHSPRSFLIARLKAPSPSPLPHRPPQVVSTLHGDKTFLSDLFSQQGIQQLPQQPYLMVPPCASLSLPPPSTGGVHSTGRQALPLRPPPQLRSKEGDKPFLSDLFSQQGSKQLPQQPYLMGDKPFLSDLFSQLRSKDPSSPAFRDLPRSPSCSPAVDRFPMGCSSPSPITISFLFYPLLSSSFLFYPLLSSSFLFYPLLSSSFLFYPLLSSSFLFYPLLSSSFLFYPLLSSSFLFYPLLSSSFLFYPLLSSSFLFYPLLSSSFLPISHPFSCRFLRFHHPLSTLPVTSPLASPPLFPSQHQHPHVSSQSRRPLTLTDMLMSALSPDPAPLRTFLNSLPHASTFSSCPLSLHLSPPLQHRHAHVKGMVERSQGEGGSHVQLLEILRQLLDTDTMDTAEKNKFLDVFYEEYVDVLVKGITTAAAAAAAVGGGGGGSGGGGLGGGVVSPAPEVLASICDLLCFCVLHHSFRMKYYVLRNNVAEKVRGWFAYYVLCNNVVEKVLRLVRRKERYYVLRNNVVEKVLRLVRRKERYLVVAAVRFLRSCISLKDDFYLRYLVKNRLFEPVIAAFRANGSRYNLLNSAVLDLVEFIRKENIKSLVTHLVETYGSWFDSVDYVDSFKLLRLKYEQVRGEWAHGRGGMGAWEGRNGRMGGEEWAHGRGGMGAWGGRNGRMGGEEWAHGGGGMGAWGGRNGRMGREEWAHGRGGMGAWEGRNGRMGGEEWAHGRGGMGAWEGRNGRMGGEGWAHGRGGMGAWEGRNGRMGVEEWAHGRGGMGAWGGRNGRMGGEEWAHGRGGMGAWEGRNGRMGGGGMGAWGGRNGRMGGEEWAHGRGGMGAWGGRNGRMGGEEWAHGRGGMGAWEGRNGRMGGDGGHQKSLLLPISSHPPSSPLPSSPFLPRPSPSQQTLESMRTAEEPSAPHFFTPPLVPSPLLPLPSSSFPFPNRTLSRCGRQKSLLLPLRPPTQFESCIFLLSSPTHTPPSPLSQQNLESLRPAEEPSAAFPLSHLLSTSASLAMPHCFSPAPPLPPPFLSQQNLDDEDEPAAQEEEHDDSLPVLDPSGTPPLPRHKSRSPSPPRSLANGIIPPEPSRKPLHGLVDYEDEDDEDRPSSCSPFPPSPRPSSGSPASGRGFEAREEARGEARNGPKRSGTGGAGSGGKDGPFQGVQKKRKSSDGGAGFRRISGGKIVVGGKLGAMLARSALVKGGGGGGGGVGGGGGGGSGGGNDKGRDKRRGDGEERSSPGQQCEEGGRRREERNEEDREERDTEEGKRGERMIVSFLLAQSLFITENVAVAIPQIIPFAIA
ncbi:unnamed protein product [Closterium sp. NIES-64]|nr:unnamed protein product [Closterium sp. NIES-64]